MMRITLPLARPRPGVHRPRSPRGFTLVELLAVIAILAIIAILGGGQISKAWKRQKTQSASTDIKVLFQRALPEVQRRNMRTFIQVGPMVMLGADPGHLPLYLIGDANQDGALGAFCRGTGCPDLLIEEYDIILTGKTGTLGTTGVDQEFSLSDVAVDQVESTFWSYNVTDWLNPRSLMCDFQGRAINPVTGQQIAGPATLVFTHVNVVNKSLWPLTRYVLSINPVWSVRVAKQIYQDAVAGWVTQDG